MASYCIATYRCFDEKADFHKKAQAIAVGLTVGSWTDLPEARKKEMEKHLGQVVSVQVHEPSGINSLQVHEPSGAASSVGPAGSDQAEKPPADPANHFPDAKPSSDSPEMAGLRYADIQIAYPDANFSRDIPALLVTVFGKLSMDGKIKLIDLSFSEDFISAFPGPKFGISGVRDILGVHDRPLLMSIFKSVIGHDLPALKEQFFLQALGGVDLIKDDEILFENPRTPIEKRVEACMEAARQAKEKTGQNVLYAVNLTGPTFRLREQAKKAIDAGANALLFNVLAYGFDALRELSADPDIRVPIAAHPSLAGAFYPSPYYGISAQLLLGKLMRLCGADLVLFPSPYGSVVMPKEENMAIKHALLTANADDFAYKGFDGNPAAASGLTVEAGSGNPAATVGPTARTGGGLSLKPSFPVPSAGIHPGLVPLILRDFGTDVVVNAGGGIHGHPQGAPAGGRAFRQAIDAALSGKPLREYAAQHPELQAAIELWGIKE